MKSNLSGRWDWNLVRLEMLSMSCNLTHVPGLKLLGFKNRKELVFEDNIKHSVFINPDEMVGTYAYTFTPFNSSVLGTRRTPGANAPLMRF